MIPKAPPAVVTRSLQSRLILWISATIIAIGVPAAIISYLSAFQEANDLQDDHLRQVASLIDSKSLSIVESEATTDDDPEAQLIVQTLGADASASGKAKALLALPATLPDGLQTRAVGDVYWRLYVRTLRDGRKIAVGQRTAARDVAAGEDALRTSIPFGVLLPVLLVLISLVIRGMLRPIAHLGAEVDARSEYDLRPLSAAHVPDEIRPFVESINRLLERLRVAIDAQKRFVADAAHELRSPMTALLVQAQNLQHAGASTGGADAAGRLAQLKAGLTRFSHLLEQLLSMARAQSPEPRIPRPVSITGLLRRVLEDLMPLIDAKSIELDVEHPEGDVDIQIDETDGIAVIRNLVDNAIRYSPQGGEIKIRVDGTPDTVMLEVLDRGPGIAADELTRVFDPFYRSPGNEASGSGLGLAIVKGILDRVGGTINLRNVAVGNSSGLKAQLIFPRHRDADRDAGIAGPSRERARH